MPENLPRILPTSDASGLGLSIDLGSWPLPQVFKWIVGLGSVKTSELLRTFNCGIGMVLIVAPSVADEIVSQLNAAGESCHRIGMVQKREAGAEAVTFSGALGKK